jgi:hypothetical protein
MQRHTVDYKIKKPYPIFYDVLVEGVGLVSHEQRQAFMGLVKQCGYETVPVLYYGLSLPPEVILERYIGKPSTLNPDVLAEGIVVKRPGYTNQYGRQCHAKIVNPEFKEKMDGKTHSIRIQDPNNDIDYSVIVEQLVTRARLVKLLAKKQVAPAMREMSWLSKTMVEDVLLEGIMDIKESCKVLNFERFTKQVCMRTVRLINELLLENASAHVLQVSTGSIDNGSPQEE